MRVPTAFEEKVIYNQARLPSFTLCPREVDDTNRIKLIESFGDIDKVIKNVRHKYTIEIFEYKPYEQPKRDETFHNWYFAPHFSIHPPFKSVICLIWAPSKQYKIKPDWSVTVSYLL